MLASMWLATRLPPGQSMARVTSTWDGGWYLRVATLGYPADIPDGGSTIAFFPLYPALVRAVATVPGMTPLGAALLVGAVAGAAAAVTIWLLARHVWDEDVADRTLVLFSFFPGSFVLSMVYAEGAMLLLAAGCLWALVARRWLVAGLLAGVATASRPNAVALVAACAWAALVAVRTRRDWRAVVAPLLAPLGIVTFFTFLWARTGEVDAWFQAQRAGWQERIVPWAVVDDVRQLLADPLADVNNTVVVVGTVLSVLGLVLLVRTGVPGPLVVYAAAVLVLALVSETLGPRPRFVLTAFPVFFAFALRLRSTAFATVVGASACVLGAFTVLSVTTLLATP